MNPVVIAQVPENLRAKDVDVLHEIGSPTSELASASYEHGTNAAFELASAISEYGIINASYEHDTINAGV